MNQPGSLGAGVAGTLLPNDQRVPGVSARFLAGVSGAAQSGMPSFWDGKPLPLGRPEAGGWV
jgi:hypothetical protein